MGALSLRRVVWVLGIAAVAGAGVYALHVYTERRARNRLWRIRHISQVFHRLPINRDPAPLEDDPDGLARAAVRRILDPNVSGNAADWAARVIRDLAEDVGTDWRRACDPADAVLAGPVVEAIRNPGPEEPGFADALDAAVGDWTRSAAADGLEVPVATGPTQRGRGQSRSRVDESLGGGNEKGPVRCRIVATDAASGAAIPRTAVHLLGPQVPGERRRRAGGTGPDFRCEPEPQEGDILVVWAEGYEAADVPWTGAVEVAVRLEPCPANVSIALAPEDRESAGTPLVPIGHWDLDRDGSLLPLRLSRVTVPLDGSVEFPVPGGGVLALDCSDAADEVVVPSHLVLRPGAAATLRILPRADVRLEAPKGATPDGVTQFAAPDALAPVPLRADELKAWRRFLGPFSGPIGLSSDAGSWTAVSVPRIPFHAWTATSDGRRFHFRVEPGDVSARPEGEHPLPLVARPVVDGEPVPDGTVLVPGRLDWSTARALAVRPCRAAGISHFVHAGSDFARVRLAAAEVLTAVHPDRGIAWLSFDGRSAPSGSWEKGEIVVSSADGRPLAARVDLRCGWDVGQGNLWSSGVEPRGHVDPRGASSFVLRGLPCGAYLVRFDVVEREEDGTPSIRPLGSAPVTIAPERLRAEVVEPRPR